MDRLSRFLSRPSLEIPLGLTLALAAALAAGGCACAATTASRTASSGDSAYPWISDQRDGTYRNPVILADYSDPDVIRVGERYYLVASSFTSTPALPILSSRDLVNWTITGHALENLPGERYGQFQPGAGVWAPAMRAHAGVFYLFVPLPDEGIYVLTATHPEGPWSQPSLLVAGRGLIDPCPFWDDDGQAYLIHAYARSRSGIKDRLRLRPMAPDASRLLGEGEIVFSDPARHPTLEGPKIYKHNGWYYILAPAGGVPSGWQVALRARKIYGPYEDRIVLAQGRTPINGPHQGALVDTPGGQWWFVHFQDAGIYGRVVHLNPVTWQDDWPLMGVGAPGSGEREPVLRYPKPDLPSQPVATPQTSDDFRVERSAACRAELMAGGPGPFEGPGCNEALGPQWQWHANHGADWFDLRARAGWLRLRALPVPPRGLGAAPNLLLQKLPARAFTVETTVELGGGGDGDLHGGLIIVGESWAALAVEWTGATEGAGTAAGARTAAGDGAGATQQVSLRVDGRIAFAVPVARGPVRLRATMADGGACRFGFTVPGGQPRSIDASFSARAGRWVGAEVGLFAVTGDPASGNGPTAADTAAGVAAGAHARAPAHADFDYLRFAPTTSPALPATKLSDQASPVDALTGS